MIEKIDSEPNIKKIRLEIKQTAKKEPADFKNPDLTDDPLNQAQSEQEKIEPAETQVNQ